MAKDFWDMLVANKKGCVSMKKLISALLIIVCIINLVGCGIADNQSASSENDTFYPVECEVELHSKKQNGYSPLCFSVMIRNYSRIFVVM